MGHKNKTKCLCFVDAALDFVLWDKLQNCVNGFPGPGADPGFCEGGFVDSLKGTFEQK